jgi:hypothetical protein
MRFDMSSVCPQSITSKKIRSLIRADKAAYELLPCRKLDPKSHTAYAITVKAHAGQDERLDTMVETFDYFVEV